MSSKKDLSPLIVYSLGAMFALLMFAFGAATTWMADHGYLQVPLIANPADAAPTPPPLLTDVFREAWQVVETDFYGEMPSATDRTYGAIKGSLATLNDPYTYFVEPEPADREHEQLQGRFGGIGAYLELNDTGRIVLTPMVGRPADNAGIQEGDILLAVDEYVLPVPADLQQVTDRVRGPVDTTVRLQVLRGDETLVFDVTRQEIELPSVSWRFLELRPDILYVRVERFSALTDDEFAVAMDKALAEKQPAALILDLRGNPGGLLDAALAISDDMIDNGNLLIERHADGTEKRYQATNGTLLPPSLPIAVLIDGGTASAAEIVAGALQDHQRAVLVGQTTYGKGSIQRIHRLSDQSAVHVTFARWFTPLDHQIDGVGLSPTVPVTPGQSADTDPFLQAAIQALP